LTRAQHAQTLQRDDPARDTMREGDLAPPGFRWQAASCGPFAGSVFMVAVIREFADQNQGIA
jgi:hypothetical protein